MISIAFTGDIMLSRRVGEKLQSETNFSLITQDVQAYLNASDYVVGNLECPIASKANPMGNHKFKAKPNTLNQLEAFDLLTIANNHIFDCGKEGAIETSKYLGEKKKDQCGLIYNESQNISVEKNIKGKKFSFISSAVKACIKDADPIKFPKVLCAEEENVFEAIKEKTLESDYTVLIIHGGNEMITYPEPSFRRLCERYIKAGVDVVVTHHPHVLGGMEEYKKGLIFYSIGDFIFDGQSNLRRQGGILKLFFKDKKIDWELQPTNIKNDLSIALSNTKETINIKRRWDRISNRLIEKRYKKRYTYRYFSDLMFFQLDRINFMIKNETLKTVIMFLINKTRLIPFYLINILTGKIK